MMQGYVFCKKNGDTFAIAEIQFPGIGYFTPLFKTLGDADFLFTYFKDAFNKGEMTIGVLRGNVVTGIANEGFSKGMILRDKLHNNLEAPCGIVSDYDEETNEIVMKVSREDIEVPAEFDGLKVRKEIMKEERASSQNTNDR